MKKVVLQRDFKGQDSSDAFIEQVTIDEDKIVVLTEPYGIGWDNVGEVIEGGSIVKITMDGNHPFED